MTENPSDIDGAELPRLPTGVPGLDHILHGGFLRGGLYIVQGLPGTGKTILASQIIYRRAAQGERALFMTVLGENHARMLAHLRPMQFFDLSLVPRNVAYVSGYRHLEDAGPKGLIGLIRREVQARQTTLLVLDGLTAIDAKADSVFAMKQFAHELQTLASALNCTMLLLTTKIDDQAPERTMVDGSIELSQRLYGLRNERRILVHKFRGSGFIEGEHSYRIDVAGLTIFPRIEGFLGRYTPPDQPPQTRISAGIKGLDEAFGGGFPEGSILALAGPPGSGKTTLGLQFMASSGAGEPGLIFGCYETPARLRLKAAALNFDLQGSEHLGETSVLWYPLGEHIIDELAYRMLDNVRQRGVKRLFIDGLSGFQSAMVDQERFLRFWSLLSNELRSLGVTTLYTLEMPEIVGPTLGIPVSGISSLAEGMIVLRYLELQSRLHRLISIVKVREGSVDPMIRRFTITDAGIIIGEPFEDVEALLSGMARRNTLSASRRVSPSTDEDIG